MIITSYGLSEFDLKSGHLNSEKEEALNLQDQKSLGEKSSFITSVFFSIQLEAHSIHTLSEKIIKVMNFHLLTLHSKRYKDKVTTLVSFGS